MIELIIAGIILFFLIATVAVVHKEMLESKLKYDRQRDSDKLKHLDALVARGADINEAIK